MKKEAILSFSSKKGAASISVFSGFVLFLSTFLFDAYILSDIGAMSIKVILYFA